MTVFSMTGYASAMVNPAELDAPPGSSGSVSIEIRSVNSRFLDLSFKLADDCRHLEPILREALNAQLRRGKVEVRMQSRESVAVSVPRIDDGLVAALGAAQVQVLQQLPQARPLSVQEVLHWCRTSGSGLSRDDTAWDTRLIQVFHEALREFKTSRQREGDKLVAVLMERLSQLDHLADLAEPLIPQVVQRQQQRFMERWQDALAQAPGNSETASSPAAQDRALQEATAFAIRIDVAEELARLRAHIAELRHLLKRGGELGKRLDLLIQELHREANTLGSKSAALELTNISVEMKVLIEQLREQVQNIE